MKYKRNFKEKKYPILQNTRPLKEIINVKLEKKLIEGNLLARLKLLNQLNTSENKLKALKKSRKYLLNLKIFYVLKTVKNKIYLKYMNNSYARCIGGIKDFNFFPKTKSTFKLINKKLYFRHIKKKIIKIYKLHRSVNGFILKSKKNKLKRAVAKIRKVLKIVRVRKIQQNKRIKFKRIFKYNFLRRNINKITIFNINSHENFNLFSKKEKYKRNYNWKKGYLTYKLFTSYHKNLFWKKSNILVRQALKKNIKFFLFKKTKFSKINYNLFTKFNKAQKLLKNNVFLPIVAFNKFINKKTKTINFVNQKLIINPFIKKNSFKTIKIMKFLKKILFQKNNKKYIYIKTPQMHKFKHTYNFARNKIYFRMLSKIYTIKNLINKERKKKVFKFKKHHQHNKNFFMAKLSEIKYKLSKLPMTNHKESWRKKWFETKKEIKLKNIFNIFSSFNKRERYRLRKKDLFKIKHHFRTTIVPFFYGKQEIKVNKFHISVGLHSNSTQNSLWYFERQLVSILQKSKFTPTPKSAAHLVRYGYVFVNNQLQVNPYCQTDILDIIRLANLKTYSRYSIVFFGFRFKIKKKIIMPKFIERNSRILTSSIIRAPIVKDYITKYSCVHFKQKALYKSFDLITKLF